MPIIVSVIKLKKKKFGFLRLILICFICCALFVGSGYLYLRKNLLPADHNVSSVPYSFSAPENRGMMLDICGGLTFLYFDFEDERLTVIIPPEQEYTEEIFGYPIDFTVTADYRLLSAVIDYADGIELSSDGAMLRYTGVQVADILSRTVDAADLKREIITALMKKIGENGIDGEVFQYIVENTETNLTVPDCYYWDRFIGRLCKNGGIIN